MTSLFREAPAAIAHVQGGSLAPALSGTVSFSPVCGGVLVTARLTGLPAPPEPCQAPFFGFHIHAGTACSGVDFSDSDGHLNPEDCPHPHHAGDLPPLWGCGGRAFLSVLTDRFTIPEIIGRTVIVHQDPDDFTSQPAGNSGAKLACGIIRPL